MLRPLTFLAVSLLSLTASTVLAADHGEAPQLTMGDGHAALRHEVGTWDAETKVWMGPDSTPTTSQGTETNRMLGKFWVIGTYESELFGTPFHGQSQVGYDPATKKYIGTWIDSMSSSLNRLEGTMKGNKLTMYSKGIDPATGKEKVTKMVSTYPDANHKTFVSYDPVPGKKDEWRKTMEITYTKREEPKE